jgi:HPt (histidine-containing phosphotransfer) domain-containing protein
MSDQIIDRQAFETLKSMTDGGFLDELIDVFLNDTPALIGQMRAALAEGNGEELRRAAHTLKSSSASFGAAHLSSLSREVELTAKEGRLEGTGEKIDALDSAYALVKVALIKLKNGK